MKLSGEYVFAAEVQEVWDALFDPAVLAAVLPGCEKLELVDGSYLGEIKVKVGPIQGKFTGKVDLLDQVPPTSYRMVIDGKGAQGFVKATARIALAPQGSSTKITYDSDAQVGGKIATVGERLIETSAKAIVKQSLEGLGQNVVIRAEAHRQAKAARDEAAAPASAVAPSAAVVGGAAIRSSDDQGSAPQAARAVEASSSSDTSLDATPVKPGSSAGTGVDVATAAAAPAIEYKRADASKLAGAVAKEVGKAYAPIIGVVLLVLAVILYVLVR
jgi:carbon monoxide dehydrogenase subunit G